MNILLPALIIIVIGGFLPLFTHRWFRFARLAHLFAVLVGCIMGLYGVFAVWQGVASSAISVPWLGVFMLSFAVDSISMVFLLPIFLIAPPIVLYSYHYLAKEAHSWRIAVSFCFISLLIAAMALVTMAANMVTFALAWELMSVSSWLLVLYEYEKKETQQAGYLYFLFTQAGALCIFAAFGLAFHSTGLLSFDSMGQLPHSIKLVAFFLFLAGFGSKAGVFPLHIWLPHAHPAAPSHVSALLSGVMIKMGVYGILRMYLLLNDPTPIIPQIILICGMVSGILGVVYALGKQDIKRLLAYSSIENVGIILIGIGLGMLGIATGNKVMAVFGFTGGLLHMLNHAIFKPLLFMGAGSVLHQTGTRRLDQLGGLMKTMPVTGRTFLAGSLAICGLPPLNGFVSEFLIYYAAFQGVRQPGSAFLFCLFTIVSLALIGGLASGCFTKVVGIVFLGEPRSALVVQGRESGPSMQGAMILLALACLVIGVWPQPFIHLMFSGLRDIIPLSWATLDMLGSVPDNLALTSRFFLGLLLTVFILRLLLYRTKPVHQGPTWGCGFSRGTNRIQYTGASYAMSMVNFHRPFVRTRVEYQGLEKIFPDQTTYKNRVEDVAEIALGNLLVQPVLWAANRLHWIQHGRIQLYIAYIILAIAALLLAL